MHISHFVTTLLLRPTAIYTSTICKAPIPVYLQHLKLFKLLKFASVTHVKLNSIITLIAVFSDYDEIRHLICFSFTIWIFMWIIAWYLWLVFLLDDLCFCYDLWEFLCLFYIWFMGCKCLLPHMACLFNFVYGTLWLYNC